MINIKQPLLETIDLSWPKGQGKVRDIFYMGDRLLIVTTDRISAFDVVLPALIPHKGMVLNQMSLFWFRMFQDEVANHILTDNINELPLEVRALSNVLAGRTVLVKKVEMFPVECVVRGYLTGSGLASYQATGMVCGVRLPKGLVKASRLPEPIFTPTTKAEQGHDVPVTYEEMVRIVGRRATNCMQSISLLIYTQAAKYALRRGIIIADTKFEFGVDENKNLVWADEALTPDSSRFWPLTSYEPGHVQPSFDKQPLRDWLTASGWNKKPPAPVLPDDVIRATSERYLEAFWCLTGKRLERV